MYLDKTEHECTTGHSDQIISQLFSAIKKKSWSCEWRHMPLNPSYSEVRGRRSASWRPAWTTQQDPVSKKIKTHVGSGKGAADAMLPGQTHLRRLPVCLETSLTTPGTQVPVIWASWSWGWIIASRPCQGCWIFAWLSLME